jgi:hypothetical protein
MKQLPEFLKTNGYRSISFKVSKTQHLLIKASINGVKGNFILDTGASNSCIGFESIDKFKVIAQDTKTKASGAGATGMDALLSENNRLQMSRWKCHDFTLVIFDLSHVNLALRQYKAKPVDGIIGADILLKGQAIIDYYHNTLYLKKI